MKTAWTCVPVRDARPRYAARRAGAECSQAGPAAAGCAGVKDDRLRDCCVLAARVLLGLRL